MTLYALSFVRICIKCIVREACPFLTIEGPAALERENLVDLPSGVVYLRHITVNARLLTVNTGDDKVAAFKGGICSGVVLGLVNVGPTHSAFIAIIRALITRLVICRTVIIGRHRERLN
jgi:hypothetical protein